MYYNDVTFLTGPIGNNTIDFDKRKILGSDAILRIPRLVDGIGDDVVLSSDGVCYEYVDDRGKLISASGLSSLLHLSYGDKDIYIIDNHNHAFSCRWRSYFAGKLSRSSHLIHIDQHSDFADPSMFLSEFCQNIGVQIDQDTIDRYTNEILTIASFIKPALDCGFVGVHDMILSEYALLQYDINSSDSTNRNIILDIDLDFRAPEMSTEYYYQTIAIVRDIISSPQVKCITIATSPTYIDQQRALDVLRDILE